jgi:hypothetical protein
MPILRPPRVSSSPPVIQGLRPRVISYFRFLIRGCLMRAFVRSFVWQGGGRAAPVPQHVGPRQGRVSARPHARLLSLQDLCRKNVTDVVLFS